MSNTPELRFKGFNDVWEQCKLEKICDVYTGGEPSGNYIKRTKPDATHKYPIYSNGLGCNALWGYSNQYRFDIPAITFSSIGTLGCPEIRKAFFTPVIRLKTIVPKDNKNNLNFIKESLSLSSFSNNASGIPNINAQAVKEIILNYTKRFDEQEKIGNLFVNIDNLFSSKEKELEATKNSKKYFLTKMFPQEGQDVPEIRFKEFIDKWNFKPFGESFRKIKNFSISRDNLNDKFSEIKNIHYGDILIKYGFNVDTSRISVPYINNSLDIHALEDDFLKTNDVVFADTAEDSTAGKVVEIINVENQKIVAGLHTYACRPLREFESGYLGIILNTTYFHNQLLPYLQGTKVTGFNYNQLCKTVITFPSASEQKKISEFFKALDNKIENQEKELEQLKNLKKAFLNKMFI